MYTPNASKDPRYKFTTVRCGVYKLEDAYQHIQILLGMGAAECRKTIQDMIEGVDATSPLTRKEDKTPMLWATFEWSPMGVEANFGRSEYQF